MLTDEYGNPLIIDQVYRGWLLHYWGVYGPTVFPCEHIYLCGDHSSHWLLSSSPSFSYDPDVVEKVTTYMRYAVGSQVEGVWSRFTVLAEHSEDRSITVRVDPVEPQPEARALVAA